MASVVELSHFPLGSPENDPSFANACCISLILSEVGAFCPLFLSPAAPRERLDDFKDFVVLGFADRAADECDAV